VSQWIHGGTVNGKKGAKMPLLAYLRLLSFLDRQKTHAGKKRLILDFDSTRPALASSRSQNMYYFTPGQLASLEATATTAAAYLDICDGGSRLVRLDPTHYRTCGELLTRIFSVVDARQAFPILIQQSAAAREAVESAEISRHIRVSRLVFYPELSALLCRVTT
jgi:hypothetical protein